MPKASGQGTEKSGKRAKAAKPRARRAKGPAREKRRRVAKPAAGSLVAAAPRFTPTSHAYAALCQAGADAAIAAKFSTSKQNTGTVQPESGDDLTLIRGIDGAAERQLHALGCNTYAALSNLNAEDVVRIGQALGDPRRLSREGWIEQAAILATGEMTAFARGKLRTECPSAAIITFPVKNRYAHISVPKAPKARKRKKPAKSRPLPPVPSRSRMEKAPQSPRHRATNVIRFPSERVTPPVKEETGPWMMLAAPIVLVALAALSSLGWSTNFPTLVKGLGCTDTLPALFVACQYLPGLMH